MEFDQEYSTFLLIFICKQIEALSFRIMDDFFNTANIECLI